MTVTQTLMEIGDWSVRLRPDTPHRIRQLGTRWYQHLLVTRSWVPTEAIDGNTAPLYRGVHLDFKSGDTIAGSGLEWYLGSASSDPAQTSGWGPEALGLWPGVNTVSSILNTIIPPTGLTWSRLTGVPSTVNGSGINGTPRTWLDIYVADKLNAEWRVRHDGTMQLYTAASAVADPVALISDDPAGRDPGSPLVGWQIGGITPDLTVRDRRRRAVVRYNTSPLQSGASAFVSGHPKGMDGSNFVITEWDSISDGDLTQANAAASGILDRTRDPARGLTIELSGDAPVADLTDPDLLCGSAVYVYLPDLDIVDMGADPMPWRGRHVFPAVTRVTEVSWPIVRGMGVYLDNRHQSGAADALVDITDWVDWDTGSTRLTMGAMPRRLDGKRRTILAT